MPSVSAIVPLFNEQTTVARVVETLAASRLIEEVICVDDGSTDESRAVLEDFGERIVLVACGSNGGKGRALAEGLGRASGEIVAFFDADLTNLSEAHIEALLAPILGGARRGVHRSPWARARCLAGPLSFPERWERLSEHDPAIMLAPAPCTLANVDDRGEYSSQAGTREPGR